METVGLSPTARRGGPLELSGGQRQRLAIARALAVEPRAADPGRGLRRPRRLRAGADRGPAAGAARPAAAHVGLRLARPRADVRPRRPGGGPARGPDRRAGRRRAAVLRARGTRRRARWSKPWPLRRWRGRERLSGALAAARIRGSLLLPVVSARSRSCWPSWPPATSSPRCGSTRRCPRRRSAPAGAARPRPAAARALRALAGRRCCAATWASRSPTASRWRRCCGRGRATRCSSPPPPPRWPGCSPSRSGSGGRAPRRGAAATCSPAATAVLLAVPDMVVALALLLLAVRTGWFPGRRDGLPGPRAMVRGGASPTWRATSSLPVTALVLGVLPVLLRHVRAAVADALDAPFVRGGPRARPLAAARAVPPRAARGRQPAGLALRPLPGRPPQPVAADRGRDELARPRAAAAGGHPRPRLPPRARPRARVHAPAAGGNLAADLLLLAADPAHPRGGA